MMTQAAQRDCGFIAHVFKHVTISVIFIGAQFYNCILQHQLA